MKQIITVALALLSTILAAMPSSNLEINSPNGMLNDGFNWAKNRVLKDLVVYEGNPNIGRETDQSITSKYGTPMVPSYWGSYTYRECFCIRDITHQASAGHLLGLKNENQVMFNLFAKVANANKVNPFWPYWALNFWGEGYFLDKNWRELPAPFEAAEKCYQLYKWTGDSYWIDNTDLLTYYENLQTKYMEYQDVNKNGVADETKQLATIWEQDGDNLLEAADALGCQYQSLKSYANILRAKGENSKADTYDEKAQNLLAYFQKNWYSNADMAYIRGFDKYGNFKTNWGHECTFFMLMKEITELGPKTDALLDFVQYNLFRKGINIEAQTYLPETFYKHGHFAEGWDWHKKVILSRHEYPEVSFLIVSNTVEWVMGVEPDAPNKKFSTLPRLNSELPWIEMNHINIGKNDLKIRHDKNTKTSVTNQAGDQLTWRASFYGNFKTIEINGTPYTAQQTTLNGKEISFTETALPVGQTTIAEAKDPLDCGFIYLSDLGWSNNTNPTKTALDMNANGKILTLNEKTYQKGLGVKPASEIVYQIDNKYQQFIADIGLDEEVLDKGSVTYLVYLDDLLAFEKSVVGSSPTERICLDVRGKKELKLIVNDSGTTGLDDLANWGNARFTTNLTSLVSFEYNGVTNDLNNNQVLDAGETAQFSLVVANKGVVESGETSIKITILGDNKNYLTINQPQINLGKLAPNSQQNINFEVSVAKETPIGTDFRLIFTLNDGQTETVIERKAVTTIAYLSDMNWTYAKTGWGNIMRDLSVTESALSIGGVRYKKGLGTHASSDIRFNLDGKFARFRSFVGVSDATGNSGSVKFKVVADNETLFESALLKGSDGPKEINVSVSGKKELKLLVTDGGNGNSADHANWAMARLFYTDDTGIEEFSSKNSFEISSIYPNPANPSTNITFKLTNKANVSVEIFNTAGQQVAKIIDNKPLSSGSHTCQWNAVSAATGVYFVSVKIDNVSLNRKVVILK